MTGTNIYPKPAAAVKLRTIQVHVKPEDYQRIVLGASIRRVPINHLTLELMEPGLKRLRKNPPVREDDEE